VNFPNYTAQYVEVGRGRTKGSFDRIQSLKWSSLSPVDEITGLCTETYRELEERESRNLQKNPENIGNTEKLAEKECQVEDPSAALQNRDAQILELVQRLEEAGDAMERFLESQRVGRSCGFHGGDGIRKSWNSEASTLVTSFSSMTFFTSF
jgi:hypothetical protein